MQLLQRRTLLLFLGLATLRVCLLSAAEQKVLYEKQSEFNDIQVVEDEHGLRTLLFEKTVRQSVVKPGDPEHIELAYAKAMPAGLALVEQPKRLLIIGLGGGTLPSFLRRHYPQMTIDIVDIDPEVVAVAKRYFDFKEDDRMHVFVQDGRKFIEDCRQPYDVIMLDAFGAENIPYHLATRPFLVAVRKAVAPGGVVVSNVWSREANNLYDSMVRTYQEVFDDLYILGVPTTANKILIALPRKTNLARERFAAIARQLSQQQKFRFDLGEIVSYRFQHAVNKDTRGEVLEDKK
jgi:spermidine synthase